jgi:hypothetical protein
MLAAWLGHSLAMGKLNESFGYGYWIAPVLPIRDYLIAFDAVMPGDPRFDAIAGTALEKEKKITVSSQYNAANRLVTELNAKRS